MEPPAEDRCSSCRGSLEKGQLPDAFGPYRVLGVIGQGGMGVVYRARHEATGEEVAVKTVRVRRRFLLHRIRREVNALARIRHPGLVRIIETGQTDGLPWYAMELLVGVTLQEYFRRAVPGPPGTTNPPDPGAGGLTEADFVLATGDTGGASPAASTMTRQTVSGPDPGATVALSLTNTTATQGPREPPTLASGSSPGTVAITGMSRLPSGDQGATAGDPAGRPGSTTRSHAAVPLGEWRTFLGLISRLCGTLAYLHGEGVVHRDIKPQNVFLRPDGTPVLLDFGLAAYFGADGRESLEVGVKVEGTPEYMAPEQIRGELVDARADLYSIGCLLYEGITGRVPFLGSTPANTLRAHVKVPPIPPRVLRNDVPDELDALILRLLAKDPGERLGHARDVVVELTRIGAEVPDWPPEVPRAARLPVPARICRSDRRPGQA